MPSGATLLRNPQKGNTASTKGKFRLDIQGLRAFAVIVVILDHMFAWPSGGFVGVDIFFVISGFLITGHLMREWEQTGQISFWKFYKGRIKRILPAATLVLVVTVVASFFLLNKSRAWSVFWDGIWATFFSGNWRFAAAGTDYFQADGPVSPLQHFWSLAVEEQFYFVWPWLMLLALLLVGRSRSAKIRPRVVAGLLIGAISAASFAWAMLETSAAPTMAYFSTFSRTWELGLGALLAIATPLLLKINHGARPVIAWVGIAGMVLSIFVINSSQAFPAPTALLPVLATVLVIAAGTGGEQKFLTPLANPVTKYIGNISYSLYLWHFPVIILVGPLLPWEGVIGFLVQIFLIGVLSVLAYHMWEDTVRKGPWLDGRQAWKHYKLPSWYGTVALGGLAAVTALAVASVFLPQAPSVASPVAVADSKFADSGSKKEDSAAKAEKFTPEVQKIQDGVATALAATKWPKTHPSMDEAVGGDSYPDGVGACGAEGISLTSCTFGDPNASKTAVIVGDSVAMRWVASLLPKYAADDWKLQVRARFGCPSFDVNKTFDSKSDAQSCSDHNEQVLSDLRKDSPDLLLISNTYVMPPGESGSPVSVKAWGKAAGAYLDSVKSIKNVALLSAPPATVDVRECYAPRSVPADCTGLIPKSWTTISESEAKAANSAGANYVDTQSLFCTDGGCPPVIDSVPVKHDNTHITMAYANLVSPALVELIGKIGK